MNGYKDLTTLTRIIAWLLPAEMILTVVLTVAGFYVPPPGKPDLAFAAFFSLAFLAYVLFTVVSFAAVGRWIYLASANAHLLSDEMTISPGWAVGWYFIPIANLVLPYQAMREIWLASHFRRYWHGHSAPHILVLWWTLWVTTRILGGLSLQLRFGGLTGDLPAVGATVDIAAAALNIPLCLVVIAITRRITEAQKVAGTDRAFA